MRPDSPLFFHVPKVKALLSSSDSAEVFFFQSGCPDEPYVLGPNLIPLKGCTPDCSVTALGLKCFLDSGRRFVFFPQQQQQRVFPRHPHQPSHFLPSGVCRKNGGGGWGGREEERERERERERETHFPHFNSRGHWTGPPPSF